MVAYEKKIIMALGMVSLFITLLGFIFPKLINISMESFYEELILGAMYCDPGEALLLKDKPVGEEAYIYKEEKVVVDLNDACNLCKDKKRV